MYVQLTLERYWCEIMEIKVIINHSQQRVVAITKGSKGKYICLMQTNLSLVNNNTS